MAAAPLAAAAAWSAPALTKVGRSVPRAAGLTARDMGVLASFVADARGRLLALTGAGCSTESGIPDYRSPEGSYAKGHKPMVHASFIGEPEQRARYWARSLKGWRYFAGAQPNRAHRALAALESAGHVAAVVTQNVDGLHLQAGSHRVVELHGRNDAMVCLACGARQPRVGYQQKLEAANAAWVAEFLPPTGGDQDIRADGDAHLAHEDFRGFRVLDCTACGGVLMPDVVFFGGTLRKEVREEAQRCIAEASCLLILGSSCQVFSAFQLVQSASRAGKPLALVNIGETRADPLVPESLRFPVHCGHALEATCRALGVAVAAPG